MIWDLHCHLPGFGGRTPEEAVATMIELGGRVGIERFCLYMGMEFHYDPTEEEVRRANDEVLRALDHWRDKVFGFAYVNPKYPELSLRELDRCIRNGPMVGVKLWVARRANTPEVDVIIKRAAELKAVIFQHTWQKVTGSLPGESIPTDVAELARRHPDVPIICGHTGGDWELGIRAVRSCPNVSVDLAGSDPTAGFTEMAVRELGARRVIYGSDAGGRSFGSQLGKVMGADISEEDRRLILGDNLRRMVERVRKV